MNSMDEYVIPGTMPILALRGLAVFPKQTIHFEVGRLKSMKAVEQAMKADHMILLLPLRSSCAAAVRNTLIFTYCTMSMKSPSRHTSIPAGVFWNISESRRNLAESSIWASPPTAVSV